MGWWIMDTEGLSVPGMSCEWQYSDDEQNPYVSVWNCHRISNVYTLQFESLQVQCQDAAGYVSIMVEFDKLGFKYDRTSCAPSSEYPLVKWDYAPAQVRQGDEVWLISAWFGPNWSSMIWRWTGSFPTEWYYDDDHAHQTVIFTQTGVHTVGFEAQAVLEGYEYPFFAHASHQVTVTPRSVTFFPIVSVNQ